jgi:uncharacterized LabA/DUF88 family protein
VSWVVFGCQRRFWGNCARVFWAENGGVFMIGGIFVDGANVAIGLRDRGNSPLKPFRLSYEKLLLVLGRTIKRVKFSYRCYYTTYREPQDVQLGKRRELLDILRKQGWSIFESATKEFADGSHKDVGVDISIALDAYQMCMSGSIDTLVLMTGDCDFTELLKRIRPKIRKYVVYWKHGMATELKNYATPIYLEDLQKEVEY